MYNFRVLKTTFIFYLRVINTVIKAAFKAKRGQYTNKEWIQSSIKMREHLEKAGVKIDVDGLKYLREANGPVIVIGNHMSTLETFVLPMLIEPIKHVTYIVKDTLISYPVFGHIMRSRGPIVVTRRNPRKDFMIVIEEGVKKLKEGTSLIIFPQSTRNVNFNMEDFNSIGVKLARRAGVEVIPLALKTDAWGNGPIDLIKDYGSIRSEKEVHFAFGPPLNISGNGHKEHEFIKKFIQDKLEEWGGD